MANLEVLALDTAVPQIRAPGAGDGYSVPRDMTMASGTTLSAQALSAAGNLTLSGGTANGVLYLNGSKVATSGSALTFDGTNFGVGTSSVTSGYTAEIKGSIPLVVTSSSTANSSNFGALGIFRETNTAANGVGVGFSLLNSSSAQAEYGYIGAVIETTTAGSQDGALIFMPVDNASRVERMRLDSSGNLGIGTSSPAYKLQVETASATADIVGYFRQSTFPVAYVKSGSGYAAFGQGATNGESRIMADGGGTAFVSFYTGTGTEKARIDASGNLGLGVVPSAWTSFRAMQIGNGYGVMATTSGTPAFYILSNAFYDGAYKYIGTGYASEYYQYEGTHVWRTAASGTAGNAITFSQAMTLDASGNLMVGTTTPSPYSGTGGSTVFTVSGTTNPSTAYPSIRLQNSDSSVVANLVIDANNGAFLGTRTNNYFGLYTNNTERARIPSAGGFQVVNCVSVGNATPSTSGAGVTFPATQSASSDANTLDDYEEGTWTGTLKGSTTDPTTPVTATGKYTKVGRQVTVVIYFDNVNTTGAAGAVFITGLPFTEDGTRAVGTAATYLFDFDTTTSIWFDFSGTRMDLIGSKDDAAWATVLHNAGAGRYLRGTGTYFV